ncbi:hypothetical protein N665_3016s0002 [Sinapis alba]|nr:hypothetical protein N665_3016s0002 [Sinapis alba]
MVLHSGNLYLPQSWISAMLMEPGSRISYYPSYGKLTMFTIRVWDGSDHGGLLAGLAACGVMVNIVLTASNLTQDSRQVT